ncbi:MAG: triose-phosphate isomerase [Acidiferrobacterales bacterium]
MRRPMVAGNWKMNGTQAEAAALVGGIEQGLAGVRHAEILVCPPYILVPVVAEWLSGSRVTWGGQNLSAHKSGAYTGEISGSMLRDFGCSHVIVGHSERRALYGESDQTVAEKFRAAQSVGLVPILCVGETLAEREASQTETVVARQLDAVVKLAGIAAMDNAIVAYEPVWAIGTGRTATPEQAQSVHAFIRARLAQLSATVAERLRILYGGSVKAANAQQLFGQPDIDGGLIGGASLDVEEFLAICRAAG